MSDAVFVGRTEAVQILDDAAVRALELGTPQFVTLFGPPGIGKTQTLLHWAARLSDRAAFRVVRVTSTGDGPAEGEPFGLLAQLLRARFEMPDAESPAAALARFRAELTTVFGDRRVAEVAGLLGRYLGVAVPDSPLLAVLTTRPEQETELARAVLCRFLEADAARQPLLLILDDLHTADDASLDVLDQLAAELAESRILVCAAARSELAVRRPGWGRGSTGQARVDLAPLAADEIAAFIASDLRVEAVTSAALVSHAAKQSGGNPALLHQWVRLTSEAGALVVTDGEVTFDDERAATVTLTFDSMERAQSRVARLSLAERELLARAAVFGPVFWTGGIVTLGRLGVDPADPLAVFAPDPTINDVRTVLAGLTAAGFVVEQASSPIRGEQAWTFCQDTERTTLLAFVVPEQLRRWSRFAAQWLEGRVPANPNAEWFERLANLYRDGGDDRRAGQCLLRAGDAALRRLRHDRARTLFERGVALLDVDDSVRLLDAFHKLGDLCVRTGRSDEAVAHFGQMLLIAWRLDLPGKGGAAHARLGRVWRAQGDLARTERHLSLARVLFDLANDRPGIASVLDDLGRLHHLRGQYDESIACHSAALVVREELDDQRGRALTLSWMGLTRMQGGDFATARAHFREALAQSRRSRDAHGIVFSLLDLGRLEREEGRPLAALALLDEARGLAQQMGERLYECHIGLQIGECHVALGDPMRAEVELRAVKLTARQFGARRLMAEAERVLADARLLLGDASGAHVHARAALDAARAMGTAPAEGAALRALGSAIARGAPGDVDQGGAREIFDRAVELLENVGAELELGRALRAYAEYEQDTGRTDAAGVLRAQADAITRRTEAPAAPA